MTGNWKKSIPTKNNVLFHCHNLTKFTFFRSTAGLFCPASQILNITLIRELIPMYQNSEYEIFRNFVNLLEKYRDYIINSFVKVEKRGYGKVYESRLSNGPLESIKRKAKDLKRSGRSYRDFEHFRNRFLYASRQAPILNGTSDYNTILYFEYDDN